MSIWPEVEFTILPDGRRVRLAPGVVTVRLEGTPGGEQQLTVELADRHYRTIDEVIEAGHLEVVPERDEGH